MSNLPSGVQENIDEQCRVVETLLAQQQIVFEGRTVETTDDMGIYVFRTGIRMKYSTLVRPERVSRAV